MSVRTFLWHFVCFTRSCCYRNQRNSPTYVLTASSHLLSFKFHLFKVDAFPLFPSFWNGIYIVLQTMNAHHWLLCLHKLLMLQNKFMMDVPTAQQCSETQQYFLEAIKLLIKLHNYIHCYYDFGLTSCTKLPKVKEKCFCSSQLHIKGSIWVRY